MKKGLCILSFLLVILLLVIVIYAINKDSYGKYNDNMVEKLSRYYLVDGGIYEGITTDLKSSETISIDSVSDISLNKTLASYLLNYESTDKGYSREICKNCYKGFTDDDTIFFYTKALVEDTSKQAFGKVLKWQEYKENDERMYNTLYYDKNFEIYYMAVMRDNDKDDVVMKLKSKDKNKEYLHLYYYFGYISKNIDETSEEVKYELKNIKNEVVTKGDDLYVDNDFNYDKYQDKLNIIRYLLKWDKENKIYKLDKIILEK